MQWSHANISLSWTVGSDEAQLQGERRVSFWNSNGGMSMSIHERSTRGKESRSIRRMVMSAMLSAVTAILVFTPIGMILLPPPLPAVTMVHIPVILAALVEGPLVGLAVGLVFGVCSLIRAWESGMAGLTLFFRNPLVSVLPRLLIPLTALGIYLLLKKVCKPRPLMDRVAAGVAAVFGALTNTICCLGMILLLYGQELNELLNVMLGKGEMSEIYANQAAGWLVTVVGLPNGIAEAVVAAVLIPILKTAVDAFGKRAGRVAPTTAQKGRKQ